MFLFGLSFLDLVDDVSSFFVVIFFGDHVIFDEVQLFCFLTEDEHLLLLLVDSLLEVFGGGGLEIGEDALLFTSFLFVAVVVGFEENVFEAVVGAERHFL